MPRKRQLAVGASEDADVLTSAELLDQTRRLSTEPIATAADLQDRLSQLTPTQLRYLEALLGTTRQKDAAALAGINRTTPWTWGNLPEVQALVQALRVDGALVTVARERLRRLASAAVDTFEDNLTATFAKDRNVAAAEILDRAGLGKRVDVRIEAARPAEEAQSYIARLNAARIELQAGGISLGDDDDAL